MPLAEIERTASAGLSEAGFSPDYAVVRNADDLSEVNEHLRSGLVALLAARLGTVRLIDNMACDPAV